MKNLSRQEMRNLTSDFIMQNKESGIIGGYCEEDFPLYYANEQMAELLGYQDVLELNAAIEGKVINTIHPEDREQVARDLGPSYHEGMTYETTYRMPRKDGTWFWTVDRGKVVRAEDGRLAILSVCTDMSKFVQRQKELEAKTSAAEYMFKNSPGGYYRCAVDAERTFLYVSERFLSMLGWTEEEIRIKSDNKFMNLLHPKDRSMVSDYVGNILVEIREKPYEEAMYRLQCRDGYHWFLNTAVLTTVNGTSFYQGFLTDITLFIEERERKERELRDSLMASGQRYEIISALGAAYEEICQMDLTTQTFLVVSGPYEGQNGPLSRISEEFLSENIAGEFLQRSKEYLDFSTLPERMQNKKIINSEIRSKSGKWFSVSFIVKKRDSQNTVTHVILTVRNVTEQKERELEQKRLTELRLQTLTEAIHGGFKSVKSDSKYSFLMVSEQLAEMLGYDSPEEMIQLSDGGMLGIVNPEDAAREIPRARETALAGKIFTMHYRIRCKNGEYKNVEDRGRRIVNEDGEEEFWSILVDREELAQKSEALNEAKTVNEKLAQKQNWTDDYYKNLLDMVNCGVVAYSIPEHQLLHVNAEAMRVYGAKSFEQMQQIMKMVLQKTVYQDPMVLNRLKNLRMDEGAVDYECTMTNLEGQTTNILARTEAFTQIDGGRCVVTTFLDVSDNLALKNEKKVLETLCSDYTAVYLCDLEQDHVVPLSPSRVLTEPLMQEKLGPMAYRFSFRVKYGYDTLVVQESAPDFMEKMNPDFLMEYLKEHRRYVYRLRVKENSTGYLHFEIQVVRMENADGEKAIIGFRYIDDVIREEIRQKALLENALAASNRRGEIIQTISKLYWQIFTIDLVKDSYKEIFTNGEFTFNDTEYGGVAHEVFQKAVGNYVMESYRPQMERFLDYDTLQERMIEKDSISAEYQTKYGSYLTARYIAQSRGQDGKLNRVLFLIQITDSEKRKELEYQKKLETIAEEARLANEAKTNFLRRMSHDIRTPLNGIIGLLKIDEAHLSDMELVRKNHAKMNTAASHLLSLINDVLETSKIEDGKTVLTREVFSVQEISLDVINIISTRANETGITWEYERNEDMVVCPYLYGSPLHIRQIFLNIYGNCIKYNRPHGKIKTRIDVVAESEQRITYRWTITDTGIGMSEEFLKHIFEPFSQENSDARTRYHGVGLGMSIVKGLIEQMGGTIEIQSRKNVGSTFIITLPFEIAESPETDGLLNQEQKDIIRGLHMLLVEDNELNAEIAEALLADEGARVTVASNGKEAVDLFHEHSAGTYDLILMDVMMPVMNGMDATRAIRTLKREDAGRIPIIAMTANAFKEDEEKCLEAGMNAHLAKPLDMERLKRTVWELLSR